MKNFLFVFLVLLGGCASEVKKEISLERIPISNDEYWGYMDKKGKVIINYQFKEAYLFSEGLALVKSADEKFGFIDQQGKWMINPIYYDAHGFSEGLALVEKESFRMEYINTAGETKFILAPEIESATNFSNGMALVRIKDHLGYVNKKGELKIAAQFIEAGEFKEGMAHARLNENDKFGYIDTSGRFKIAPQFEYAASFSNGLALVKNANKYGYIDTAGKYVIQPQFDYAGFFEDELAICNMGRLYGFIDKKGNWAINAQFDQVNPFAGNSHTTVRSIDGTWGIINKQGKFVNPNKFEYATRFYDGIAFIEIGGNHGFINETGRIEINPLLETKIISKERGFWLEGGYLKGIVSYIMSETSDMMVDALSEPTTFSSLKKKYPNLTEHNYSSFKDFDPPKNDYITLTELRFSFQDTSIDNTDLTNPKIREDATLSGVNMKYNLHNISSKKVKNIFIDFAKILEEKYLWVSEPGTGSLNILKKQNHILRFYEAEVDGSVAVTMAFGLPR